MFSKKTREQLGAAQRWVVKIGSAMITNDGQGLDRFSIDAWVAQMAELHQAGRELLLVTSGAVAEGMRRLGWSQRPTALADLQAAAAVGQMGLVQAWESAFERHGIQTAQILLTHEDASDRQRYLNIRSTLRTLLRLRVVPVINENDTVAFEEIRFGDNDTLGALVANLVEAELYVILTDQQGLYDKNPRQFPDARLIGEGRAGDAALEAMAGGAGSLGSGGMTTKLHAATRAARSGAFTLLAWGREPEVLRRVAAGVGTGHPAAAQPESAGGAQAMAGGAVAGSGPAASGRRRGAGVARGGEKPAAGRRDRHRGQVQPGRSGGLPGSQRHRGSARAGQLRYRAGVVADGQDYPPDRGAAGSRGRPGTDPSG